MIFYLELQNSVQKHTVNSAKLSHVTFFLMFTSFKPEAVACKPFVISLIASRSNYGCS